MVLSKAYGALSSVTRHALSLRISITYYNKLVPKGAGLLAHYQNSRLGRSLSRVLLNSGCSLGAHD